MTQLDEFRLKLADLMEQYYIEIEANDVYPGYPECGEDIQISFSYGGIFTKDEYIPCESIEFGQYLDVKNLRDIKKVN